MSPTLSHISMSCEIVRVPALIVHAEDCTVITDSYSNFSNIEREALSEHTEGQPVRLIHKRPTYSREFLRSSKADPVKYGINQ